MKIIPILACLLLLPSCAAVREYSPMLTLGLEVKGQKFQIGFNPLPVVKREPQPVDLPAIVIPGIQ
jgi:hypothetical protein